MGNEAKWQYFRGMYERYHQAERKARGALLDELRLSTGYNRKYAIRLLNGPRPEKERVRRPRGPKTQMDRRLQSRKREQKRKIYGRTKPGTLLKHPIPLKTDGWDVQAPGFTEVDLVLHSGHSAEGEFAMLTAAYLEAM